jgi:hypothetical protein
MNNLVHIIVPTRKEKATALHKIVGTIAPRKKGKEEEAWAMVAMSTPAM